MGGMCAAAQKIVPARPPGQARDTPSAVSAADPGSDNRSDAREDVGMDRRLNSLEIDVAILKETVATQSAISELRAETKVAISELRAEMKADMGSLRASLHRELNAQTWKMIGACAVLVAATWYASHPNYVAVPAVPGMAAAAVPGASPSPLPASALC
jgi:hypothetical protein